MNKERIEEKLMWMNVDPWDSYRWLAEYIITLEDKIAALESADALKPSHNTASMPCPLWCADSPCRIFDGSVYKCGPYQCSIGGAQHT